MAGMLVCGLLVATVVSIGLGAASISVANVVSSVTSHFGVPLFERPPALIDSIVWGLRLPRIATAAAVGAGLALSGVVMQSVSRNALADPYLLGISSGASVGAVCVLVIGLTFALPVAAFLGAFIALLGSLAIARAGFAVSPGRMILAGIAMGQLCAALTSFLIFWSAKGDALREIMTWHFGSFASSSWTSAAIAWAALGVICPILIVLAPQLDAFAFGETTASALGVDVTKIRWMLLGSVALLTGVMVSQSGAIGFVGLVVPHLARPMTGTSHRRLLAISGLCGALLLVVCDTLARTAFTPRELPVGVITAAVGAPLLIALIRRRGVIT
ncbi:iron chelate uptake ABC transporter family permease subunit [Leifsonia sp. NPDC056824]|uniref:iron chelate uptake ABC transporter family permease subunit n=1 Tax=Leifsonia sp. NPDC056824 TaxID=3345953 RepID=UPI0036C287B8